ncbi:hypothetical protein SAMN04487764_2552 [Gillisia sp. Hel1_33_143]|uniref:hypothetical protein n=1 Tax=Gillisia sp. Hel1_33_143 TaxID=1336796 RepID=UPI0008798EA4|nr:hypothetical protein [Gillisia sp. Hel1_33_143]SDS58321.1 hypothetical protein SAMN04487764_2552 [Gillisia sp. Hel1_33_143]
MKTVDKMEVLHSQSAEFIAQGETGKFLKLIPDTFIIKGDDSEAGPSQGYAIRHLNRQDIILIDVVEKSSSDAVKKLITDGYNIKAILISNGTILKNAHTSLKALSEDAGGAPIYTHPRNSIQDDFHTKDITAKNEIFKHFALKIFDLPGDGGGSVLIYSEINDGMLFTGEDAIGSKYDSEENTFHKPKLKSKNDEFGMAESWGAFDEEFTYLFPLHGKPGFNLEEGNQTDILNKLGRVEE